MPGPPPEPIAVKLQKGRTAHRAINVGAPAFASGEPDMPSSLSRQAKKEWRRLVDLMMEVPNLLTLGDGDELADLCEVIAKKKELEKMLALRKRDAIEEIKAEIEKFNHELKPGAGVPKKISKADLNLRAGERALTEAGNGGAMRKHPIVVMLGDLAKDEKKLRMRLGLNPSARSTLRLGQPQAQNADAVEALYTSGPKLVKNA